jgi:hypothetical protein
MTHRMAGSSVNSSCGEGEALAMVAKDGFV